MSESKWRIALLAAIPVIALTFGHSGKAQEAEELTYFEHRDFDKGMREFYTGDYSEAYQYWLSLAREGVAEAQYNVGRMNAYGEGVPKDYEKAYVWFLRAEKNGAPEATNALRQLRVYLDQERINRARTRADQVARMEAGMEDPDQRPRLYGTDTVEEDDGSVLKDTGIEDRKLN